MFRIIKKISGVGPDQNIKKKSTWKGFNFYSCVDFYFRIFNSFIVAPVGDLLNFGQITILRLSAAQAGLEI